MKNSLIIAFGIIVVGTLAIFHQEIADTLKDNTSTQESTPAQEDNSWTSLPPAIQDAIQEYSLASQHGSKIDVCVAAQWVATLFLKVHDEKNYTYWRTVQRADCKKAGLDDL